MQPLADVKTFPRREEVLGTKDRAEGGGGGETEQIDLVIFSHRFLFCLRMRGITVVIEMEGRKINYGLFFLGKPNLILKAKEEKA